LFANCAKGTKRRRHPIIQYHMNYITLFRLDVGDGVGSVLFVPSTQPQKEPLKAKRS
jgi:hypothetical protein